MRMGVVGLGTMGSGIAQCALESGFHVVAVDTSRELVDRGTARIRNGLKRRVKSGRLTKAQSDAFLGELETGIALASLAECDIIVEAVFEDRDVKGRLLSELSTIAPSGTVIVTNTSSISVTSLSQFVKHRELFAGMHFFNPVPVMPLVEMICTDLTSEKAATFIRNIAISMNKKVVECRDFPGFVSNRILMPMINEAIFALMENVASREDIDAVMKLGMNHPMGPLELADFIGLDVCLGIMRTLHSGFGDSKYRPCPLLVRMVDAGKLGRKSGEGFYRYE